MVDGHNELSGHTFYRLRCVLHAAHANLQMEWTADRQIAQLRGELHDAAKALLGKSYCQVFNDAPFAKRGAPSGTTMRLHKWLGCLGECVSSGLAPPVLVAQVLYFLCPPIRRASARARSSSPATVRVAERARGRQGRPASEASASSKRTAEEQAQVRESQSASPPRQQNSFDDDFAFDDDPASTWSPDKRRAGYEKLQEFFRELRRALEKHVVKARREGSSSPARSSSPTRGPSDGKLASQI